MGNVKLIRPNVYFSVSNRGKITPSIVPKQPESSGMTVTYMGNGNVKVEATGLTVIHDGDGNVALLASFLTVTHGENGNVTVGG